jgi:Zn-dependent metalloprotease
MIQKKSFIIITLVFVLCCFMATNSWAAQKTDIYKSNAKDFIKKLNENKGIGHAFGLTKDEDFVLIRQITDFNGETHYRYQQTFKEFQVWGTQIVISKKADKAIKLHGAVIQDAANDVGSIPQKLDALGALREMQENHKAQDAGATWHFENETYGTYVYFHKKSKKARLCHVVSFFADTAYGNPSQMIFFINAQNNKIIDSYDMLRYGWDGTGPGGNQKIGYYYYGTDYPKFGVAVSGSTCTMNYADCRSVNLNHGTSGSTPFSYTCYENTFKQINGAYSPINDAQFFGQQIYNMYQDWYSTPVLPFQLMMRVHYSTNYENAFWNGSSMTFGDGYTTFYPLVCLDVSAHEVAHGFTDNHSDLIYSGQSGGINESYSDMAGEGAKYYMRGTNDFMCGYDIFKNPSGALRYLYDPPLDGRSIDHVDDYYSGMDVHYSSGVFNKAFYLIAVSSGWNTRMSLDIFTRANMVYWTPSTNFVQGAEGAQDAAADYGYPCADVRDAFDVVGITLVCVGGPQADFDFTTSYGSRTVDFTDTSTCSNCTITDWDWNFGDGNTSTQQNPTHTYAADGTYSVTLTVTSSASETDNISKDVTVPGALPTVGITDVYGSTSTSANRRAMPFTMPEDGTISSVTMYHTGGSGSMILGVYDGEGTPQNRLGVTPTTAVSGSTGWQTINLTSPAVVAGNTTVWLAWVYESNPGIRYQTGSPGRFQSGDTWSGGMPDPFGSGSQADYRYSIYASYTPGGVTQYTLTTNVVGQGSITLDPAGGTYPEGTVVTLTAVPDAGWRFDSWSGDLSGTQNPTTITMNSDKNVTATFVPAPQYTLTVNTVGQGSVTLDPAGGTYPEGTVVTLTAVPDAAWHFDYWSGDLSGSQNPTTITMDADKTVNATFVETNCNEIVGNTTIFGSSTTTANRRAMPFTMPENGEICSVTMYHTGGSGSMILGVYDGEGLPDNRLGVTATTAVSGSTGWQTINLTSPAYVAGGTTVWLAWVYESNPGIYYQTGSPGRAHSSQGWSGGMPDPFGSSTQSSYIYSIYANYSPIGGPVYKNVGNTTIFGSTSTTPNRRAMPFTMPEDGTIESVTMYHEAGSGGMILAVYDGASLPQNQLGVTATTTVSGSAGWQTINLTTPVFVQGGTAIWLAWVYESIPGVRYQTGSPGRAQSPDLWAGGMPDPFGSSTQASYLYSIYATYYTTVK